MSSPATEETYLDTSNINKYDSSYDVKKIEEDINATNELMLDYDSIIKKDVIYDMKNEYIKKEKINFYKCCFQCTLLVCLGLIIIFISVIIILIILFIHIKLV